MADLTAMFPIQFARPKSEEENDEQYSSGIATNEDMLNQNFSALQEALASALERISELEARING